MVCGLLRVCEGFCFGVVCEFVSEVVDVVVNSAVRASSTVFWSGGCVTSHSVFAAF